MTQRNIREFGKSYEYLKDPARRAKETGDAMMTIDNALFSGEQFRELAWKNIRFTNCDFTGHYQIVLDSSENIVFENCRFEGVLTFGEMSNVHYKNCNGHGNLNMLGGSTSRKVIFEECNFKGENSNPNHFGAIGTWGESTFIRCKFQHMDLTGNARLIISDCEFDNVQCGIDWRQGYSHVLIERSKLTGPFRLVSAALQSLTIRDCTFQTIDVSNATVKGDILLDKLRGGFVNLYVKEANSLTVRASQILGDGKDVFKAYAGGIRNILVEDVVFGSSAPIKIAGGFDPDDAKETSHVNQSIILKNTKIPALRGAYLNTPLLSLDACEIGLADFSNSRIDKMSTHGVKVTESVDFSHTQIKEQELKGFSYSGRGGAKLDDSNVKLP